jgi:hypothetical protein
VGAAGAVKNEWRRGICLTTPVAGALRSLMVWGGNDRRGGCLGGGRWGRMSGGGRGCKERVGAPHLPDDACSGCVALVNGLGQKRWAGSVLGMWKRWEKGCLRLWDTGTLGSSGGEGLGQPTANIERMRSILTWVGKQEAEGVPGVWVVEWTR